jgi:hypothetical protein
MHLSGTNARLLETHGGSRNVSLQETRVSGRRLHRATTHFDIRVLLCIVDDVLQTARLLGFRSRQSEGID